MGTCPWALCGTGGETVAWRFTIIDGRRTRLFFAWHGSALAYGYMRQHGNRAMQERLMIVGGAMRLRRLQALVETGDGGQMFYPLRRRQIGVELFGCHGHEWLRAYVRHPLFLCEVVWALVGFGIWWRERHSQENNSVLEGRPSFV